MFGVEKNVNGNESLLRCSKNEKDMRNWLEALGNNDRTTVTRDKVKRFAEIRRDQTMVWNKVIILICCFGFLKEFRPSESFISPYLNGHWKNFTETEINQKIYPVATYSNMALLVIVFLLTDRLKYKPVILLEGLAGIITWTLLPLGQSILLIQVAQFFYGLFCATEVAYYSYLYAKIEKKSYQRATSITKSTLLIGKASSSLLSQVLVLFNVMDYHELNYVTLTVMFLGTICAGFLPPVAQSNCQNVAKKFPMDCELQDAEEAGKLKPCAAAAVADDSQEKKTMKGYHSVISHFKQSQLICCSITRDFHICVKNRHILKWCLWWALSLCGYLQVTYYVQLLWQSIINKDNGSQGIYHGFSNCANCLIGAICTYMIGFLKIKWDIYGEIALALCATLQGCILLYCAHISHLITGYILHMTFRVLYQTSSTIASAEIARHIKAESYALVFGVSTFVALLGQSFLTAVVIDTLKLSITAQFIIYGNYYIAIGIGFLIGGVTTLIRCCGKRIVRNS